MIDEKPIGGGGERRGVGEVIYIFEINNRLKIKWKEGRGRINDP